MRALAFMLILFSFPLSLLSQNRLNVCDSKVVHLVCPDRVSYFLAGDPSLVLAEVAPELSNLIRIKAIQPFENETSLTIVCAGKIYSLLLNYRETDQITCQLEDFHSGTIGGYSGGLMPDYILKELSDHILSKRKGHIHGRKTEKDGIRLELKNIWMKQDALFFEVQVINKTNMDYNAEGFNWWICDKRQHKATNVQEYQVFPSYCRYRLKVIPAKTAIREVFVLPKLILPDKKILHLEMLENALGNTGRKVTLEIKNRDILKARKL